MTTSDAKELHPMAAFLDKIKADNPDSLMGGQAAIYYGEWNKLMMEHFDPTGERRSKFDLYYEFMKTLTADQLDVLHQVTRITIEGAALLHDAIHDHMDLLSVREAMNNSSQEDRPSNPFNLH